MDIDAVHVNTSDIDNCVFFFKQKTAYEMLISDWSSDVCSSDLAHGTGLLPAGSRAPAHGGGPSGGRQRPRRGGAPDGTRPLAYGHGRGRASFRCALRAAFEAARPAPRGDRHYRSEEQTSELQSLMRISYAVVCWTKKKLDEQ